MKKLVALVLALCMLLCCVPAFATLTLPEIPPTMADLPDAERPEMPDYTLEVVDDHYVLTIEGLEEDAWVYAQVLGLNEEDNAQWIHLIWNPEDGQGISDTLMDEEFNRDQYLYITVYAPDNEGFNDYDISMETGELMSVGLGIWDDTASTYFYWYDEDNLFTYNTYSDDGEDFYATYNLRSGKIRGYSIQVDDMLTVNYDRYGVITSAQIYDWETGVDCYWDRWSKQWYDMNDGSVNPDLPALKEEDYPAPYAEPYIVLRPSNIVDGLDLVEGEMEKLDNGEYNYWSDTVSARYDEDGNLRYYMYGNLEGDKHVRYSADDVLEWAYVNLPDGGHYWYNPEDGWTYTDAEGSEIALEVVPEGLLDGMDPLPDPNAPDDAVEYIWYDHNTVGLVGLSLRDMGITDKWYNVVPVDLTQDGVQVLDLVGSNLFHIGKAFVTVQDGQVTVDYELFPGQSYLKDECVQWFTALEDITADFLNNPASDVAFGQALSIADDLGGAETAILFICNRVTYRQPYNGDTGYLSRYWPNRQRWIDYRAELTELLEGMSK